MNLNPQRCINIRQSAGQLEFGHNGGETGIRTLGGLAPTTVFETAPFDHSGTSPRGSSLCV